MQPLLLINGYAATGSDWDPDFLLPSSAMISRSAPAPGR